MILYLGEIDGGCSLIDDLTLRDTAHPQEEEEEKCGTKEFRANGDSAAQVAIL